MMYPEFEYRAPPPSYQASMQEYRLRLLLLDREYRQLTIPPLTASPPPTYRSQPGTLIRWVSNCCEFFVPTRFLPEAIFRVERAVEPTKMYETYNVWTFRDSGLYRDPFSVSVRPQWLSALVQNGHPTELKTRNAHISYNFLVYQFWFPMVSRHKLSVSIFSWPSLTSYVVKRTHNLCVKVRNDHAKKFDYICFSMNFPSINI